MSDLAADGQFDVAVVGMAGRFPGAGTVAQLWENLRQGVESISFFDRAELLVAHTPPAALLDPAFVAARGVLGAADLFDAALFGLSAREAQLMDPQQRLFLECAWEALGDAVCDAARFPGVIGVYAGASQSSYFLSNLLSRPDLLRATSPMEIRLANDKDFLATAASYRLNLKGPSVTVATACSSSLVAVHLACQALLNREADLALAGGVSVTFPQVQGYLHQEGGIFSRDGHCRAFDAAASGSVGGDGVGIVVLKRLADALADRDPIRALIKGSAIGNDGSDKIGFTAPSVVGQAAVIAQAQSAAGIAAGTVTYVEAHGSGTPLGDPVEIRALTRAFRAGAGGAELRGRCAVGSLKTNIGHLDAAAGIAGLIKTVLALEHRTIPPSLHLTRPNPAIPWAETPFYVPTAAEPWESAGAPRRAGVNSFGIGGTNAHVVLEEAPARQLSGPSRPWQLLLLSAASAAAAERGAGDLAADLAASAESLADVAHSGRIGRPALRHRRALVCRDREDALHGLAPGGDAARLLAAADTVAGRPVAFLLPGVGDHYPGMARGLYETEAVYRAAVDSAAEILLPLAGADLRPALLAAGGEAAPSAAVAGPDLRRMLQAMVGGDGGDGGGGGDSDARLLERTALLQPAVFVVDYALARLWESWGVRPSALLGYSLGEYVAACLAGVLSLRDALRVVAWRARAIEQLPAGAMLAVALSEAAVEELVEAGSGLAVAAVNAAEQVVVAGPAAAAAALAERLAERRVAWRRLPTAHAFHSPLLAPLAAPFANFLAEIELRPPRLPYVTNVTGTWVTGAQATDPRHWVRHMLQPVRFAAGLAALWQEPATCLLEVGPGHGLTTLALQQRPDGAGVALPTLRPVYDPRPDGAFVLDTVAKLWLAGVEIDWADFAAGERRNRVRLPAYPFERRRYWIEPRPAGASAAASGAAVSGAAASGAAVGAAASGAAVGVQEEPAMGATAASPGASPAAVGAGAGATHPRPALRTQFVAPRSRRERRIAALWQEILRLDAVGVHDSFFELGGNSLLAPRVLLGLRQAFGVEVPLPRLLREPTVAQVARAVAELGRPAAVAGRHSPELAGEATAEAAPAPEAAADWAAEVVLDPAIQGIGEPPGDLARPVAVLLTGATGFLGPHLLRDLLAATPARVFCLVRGESLEEGLARIFGALAAHRLALPAGAAARIVPLPGDLAAPRWGLSEAAFAALAGEVEAVYHAGAWVNFTYPYEVLRPANVGGTREALRLAASGSPKALHFVSTIAVFGTESLASGVGGEDADLASPAGLGGGYAQSKWVAERLVDEARRRGIPVTIHRPGLIAGDSQTGIGNPRDLLWAFLKGSLQLGVAPELPSRFDPVPVDFVSRSLVHLAGQRRSLGRAFHYVHPQPLAWRELFEFASSLGYPVRLLATTDWARRVGAELDRSADNALAPFRSLFAGAQLPAPDEAPGSLLVRSPRFDISNTLAGLAGSSIHLPPLDRAQLAIYFQHLIASGFLPPPAAPAWTTDGALERRMAGASPAPA